MVAKWHNRTHRILQINPVPKPSSLWRWLWLLHRGHHRLHQLWADVTAHLTGDTVHLGQNLLQQQWSRVAEAAVIILAFIAGSLVGRTAIEIGSRRKAHSVAADGQPRT